MTATQTKPITTPTPALPTARLQGITLHAITEAQCIAHILDQLDAHQGGWVVTPNLDILRKCVHETETRALVNQADIRVADGAPLVWASKIQGTPLPERVAGSSLFISLSAAAAQREKSIFLLGGDPGTADAAAAILKERSPSIQIVGTHCPPMGFDRDPEKIKEITEALKSAAPDIIFVALGPPKQERLIRDIRSAAPNAWWLGVGISFSFLAGDVQRAPIWIQRIGLEWIHRLAQEPTRLAKRYLIHGIPFALRLMTTSLLTRCRGGPKSPAREPIQ